MTQPYKLRNEAPGVIRVADGMVILPDLSGYHWRQYLDWMYAGNEPDPANAPLPPPPRKLAKTVIVDRLTDDELDAFRVAKNTISARLMFLWDEAHNNEINPDDERLIGAFTTIIGAERAAEVLS